MTAFSESPGPESLLAQQDFVRALVRSLLRGADGEDDVVQGTWIRALTQPPRDANRARQWLGQVARNLVRDHQRGSVRRTRHERRASRTEPLPSAADVVQREHERKRVIDAVLGLPDPYRTAVLLRYWEDLPPRSIAERLAINDATVRSHLRRGLEMLRKRLDADYGDRGRWVAALTPCAALHTTPPITGALLMSTNSKSILTACCALLIGLAIWGTAKLLGGADGGIQPVNAAPQAAPQPASASTGDRTESESSESSESEVDEQRTNIASEGELVVAGSIEAGPRTFDGVDLKLQWFDGYGVSGQVVAEHSVQTDAAGAFRWSGAMRESPSTLQVITEDRSVQLRGEPEIVLPNQRRVRVDLNAIPLDCELFGVVTSHAGAPIDGASVQVRGQRTQSDSNGRYSLRVGRGEFSSSVRVWAPQHTPKVVDTSIEPTTERYQLDFTLQAGGSIAGRVVNASGAPVEGARVQTSAPRYHVFTDANGQFELPSLNPASTHHVEAKKQGYLMAHEDFDSAPPTQSSC